MIKLKNVHRDSFMSKYFVDIDITAGSAGTIYNVAIPVTSKLSDIQHGSSATSNVALGVSVCSTTYAVPSATAGLLGVAEVDGVDIAKGTFLAISVSAIASMTAVSKLVLGFMVDSKEEK